MTQALRVELCIVNHTNSSSNVNCNCSDVRKLEDNLSDFINRSNIQVIFCDGSFELEQPIRFHDSGNISLKGAEDKGTTIHCTERVGLSFVNVTNITVSDLTFIECGQMFNSTSLNSITETATLEFPVSIYIYNCTNVNIEWVNIVESRGMGIAIFDTDGRVEISNSVFDNNKLNDSLLSGGGGVYVEFTFCPPGTVDDNCVDNQRKNKNSFYQFHNCNFTNNNATIVDAERTSYYKAKGTKFYGLGRGGGLCLIFKGNATNNTVAIDECEFTQNGATWGAGLYVAFHDSPQNNTFTATKTSFIQNDCYLNGGGGVDIGLLFYNNDGFQLPNNNTMIFQECTFMENKATYGGGVKFYSSQSHYVNLNNSITFIDCHWERNMARYGSAIDISPQVWDTLSGGYLPTPKFENCCFVQNYAISLKRPQGSTVTFISRGKGAMICTGFSVQFKGNTTFESNNGTAMYMSSSSAYFEENSMVVFENNTGFQGGAVALFGFSVLYVNDNCTLDFTRNKADSFGGAIIYNSINKHDFSSSRSCFIQYEGTTEPVSSRQIVFTFSGNDAGINNRSAYGRTIYATTIRPCRRSCENSTTEVESCGNYTLQEDLVGFRCIGTFIFNDNRTNEVSTAGVCLTWTDETTKRLQVSPGQRMVLPFEQRDDLCQATFGLYHVSVVNNSQDDNIQLDPANAYISDKTVTLYGDPGNVATLQLATTSFREIGLSVELTIKHCQPGYVVENTSKGIDCVCSFHTERRYFGIDKCDTSQKIAYIGRAYWVGYKDSLNETEDTLESGHCPNSFCYTFNELNLSSDYPLPDQPSRELLNHNICGLIRTGKLCSRCRDDYTTFFHSIRYRCSTNEHCKLGFLFYILSELVPVTVLFLVIIFFKIRLTSGALNGFILFVQVIDLILTDANGYIQTKKGILIFMKVYRFIYRMLNMEFFTLDELSFCIWKGATTMDVLAVKYFTIVYAFLLVAVTIVVMKLYTLKCTKFSPKSSIIHGLSAFFVICYSQCTKVTLLVLTPTRIYKVGFELTEKVVYYQGDLPYMKGEHLKYAIPALFFLVAFVLVPLMLLLVYPLCYKVFALLRIEETKLIKLTCRVIPLEKMKPLFDSFQSCFKDNYRFMAGIYFLYRLIIHVPFVLTDSFTKFYVVLEIELVLMLTIQATIYAYKKHWHNILDILLFANLTIINAMTIHNYKRAKETSKNQSYQTEIDILSGIQTFLIYLPLVYVVCYIIYKILRGKRQPKREPCEYDDVTDTVAMVDYRELTSSFGQDEETKDDTEQCRSDNIYTGW